MSRLSKYSFGVGDRFGKEGRAQLAAIMKMRDAGIMVTPVWNKSHREHTTVGSKPPSVKAEAEAAVKKLKYEGDYLIDADHISLDTVEPYIPVSDFFTVDVADAIGKESEADEKKEFLKFFSNYKKIKIPGIAEEISFSEAELEKMVDHFLLAMRKAGEVYRYIHSKKTESFSTEVSVDEVENPQSPGELFFMLAALSYYKVPVNTIAPKFTGRFNKGVDYKGDLEQFRKEFEEDILVLKYAIKEFDFPENLKLSVHSGSDKFSIYPVMCELIKKQGVGLHLKTAGTTWLEEMIGLAESEGEGFEFCRTIYWEALKRYEELTKDYTTVLSIDKNELPKEDSFKSGNEFANALRHTPESENYNPHFRQLIHCAYKIAAEKKEFPALLEKFRKKIEENVTYNLYERHLKQIFPS